MDIDHNHLDHDLVIYVTENKGHYHPAPKGSSLTLEISHLGAAIFRDLTSWSQN